jgi:hypothetical protein
MLSSSNNYQTRSGTTDNIPGSRVVPYRLGRSSAGNSPLISRKRVPAHMMGQGRVASECGLERRVMSTESPKPLKRSPKAVCECCTVLCASPLVCQARSGATVTRWLCDPLLITNVLEYRMRNISWNHFTLIFSPKCIQRIPRFLRVRYYKRTSDWAMCSAHDPYPTVATSVHASSACPWLGFATCIPVLYGHLWLRLCGFFCPWHTANAVPFRHRARKRAS